MVLPCSPCRSKAVELEVVEGEAVCRWCSNHGVDGLSCSKCDSHFCRKVFPPFPLQCCYDFPLQCLNVNLGAGFIKLASASEGDWICLLCKSAPLEKLRTNLLAPIQVSRIITSEHLQLWYNLLQGKTKVAQRGVRPAGARTPRPQVRSH